ncbi:PAS domain S-box protein [Nostoc sp.]|uniref:PAS domain S-box protein n=1 Tax=Nostoc sp. TaxID=1180 RepID=UPI002FEF1074
MRTVFFVEDSAEDRALYRRFLERDDRYTYDIYEFESGNKALQACQAKIPDVILLDYRLPDLDGLEFLTKLQRQTSNSQISVIMLTGQGDETIAVQAIKSGVQDYLVKGKLTSDNLRRAVHGAIEQIQLMRQLKQQQEQQKLVGAIALNIRQSLRLQDILATSVQEVRQLLGADRVLLYQFTPQMRGSIVAESVLPQWTPILGLEIEDTCFQENQGEEYRRGKIWAATNIYEAGLSDCHIQLLEQFQVKANLVLPILLESKGTQAVELWGLFIAHQCSAPRQWQTFEVELLKQLTVQLAIAIQQAELYHNLQTLNTELEAKVQERTAKLHQSDRRFRAIFNNTFQFIGLLTPAGILLEANQTALSFAGLKLEDAIDRPFWETHWWTISPQTQAELKQAIARAAQGEFIRYEVDVLGANNRVATIDFSLRPLLDETGQVILLIPEGRDITELKQAKEKLQQSETLLATTQQIAHIGSCEFNLVTKKRCWSMETFRIFGLNPIESEPTQAEFLQMLHPEDRTQFQTNFEQAIAQETPFSIEFRIVRPDDSVRYLEGKAEIAYNAQGQAVKVLGAILDITERKQNELEIIRSRELLEAVYNESADALFLVNVETLLTIDCNDRAVKLFAASNKAELINIAGNTLQKQQFTPDELDSITAEINQQGFWSLEIEYITKQGKSFWGNIAAKQITVAGNVMNLVRVTDITVRKRVEEGRKRAEIALRESEEQLRLTLEFNHIGLWDWNVQTNEVTWNDNHYRLLGLEPEISAASYQLWRDRVHPEDVDRIEQAVSNALAQHINFQGEYRVIFPDGRVHWLTGKGRGVYNEAGDPVRMLGVIIDISEQKQAEAALQESEARFQAFMNNSPVLAWITDTDGRVLYLNQTYLRTFKLLPEQVIGQSISDLYPDEIARQHFDHIRTVIETNQVIEAIEVAPRPNGSLGEFLVYKFPILGLSAQKLVGRVAIDITERKILERELAHKQKLLDTFINNAPVGITILDGELRYSLVNEALAEINGIPAAEHIGKTTWEIVPDIARKQDQVFRQVLTTGEPILDLEVSGETPKLPGVIRTWLASYFPIQSEADEPISMGIVVVEISDRKRAEQMLELQAVITRNMAEGICLVRATDAVFVYANPKFEQMFAYDPGELIGQHVSIVNYGDKYHTPEDVNQAIRTTILKHGEATYEVHNIKKDGTPFWCSATASVFEHPEYGSVLVAIHQDITEQKQAEEKIKASLKEKEVLLKEIHHRVKNNLGIVSSLLQMQCRRTQDPVVTAILRDSQNRIASIALVHEKLYRSEDLADIDFAQYIPDLTTHLFDSYNVSSSQIKLNIQVDNASLDIETAIPCGLIINELVSNALKYAFVGNRGGKIEVKFYQKSESNLTLIIKDNGVGLPENFDSKKTKTLGITLVQGLVKQLRGKLEIDSQQGTEFKITFTNSRT